MWSAWSNEIHRSVGAVGEASAPWFWWVVTECFFVELNAKARFVRKRNVAVLHHQWFFQQVLARRAVIRVILQNQEVRSGSRKMHVYCCGDRPHGIMWCHHDVMGL